MPVSAEKLLPERSCMLLDPLHTLSHTRELCLHTHFKLRKQATDVLFTPQQLLCTIKNSRSNANSSESRYTFSKRAFWFPCKVDPTILFSVSVSWLNIDKIFSAKSPS